MPNPQVEIGWVVWLAVGSSAAIWHWVIGRQRRGIDPLPHEPRRPAPWGGADFALVIMAMLLFDSVAVAVLRDAMGVPVDGLRSGEFADVGELETVLGALMIAKVATIVFGIALVRIRHGATWEDLGLSTRRLGRDVAVGVLGFVAIAAPVYGLQAILYHFFSKSHSLIEALQKLPQDRAFVVIGVSVSVVAPWFEEMVFRVFLQGWLEAHQGRLAALVLGERGKRGASGEASLSPAVQGEAAGTSSGEPGDADGQPRPSWMPVLLSSFVFAMLHVGQGPAPAPLFFLALMLGYLYRQTHRVWPSLVVHFLLNSSTLAMLWVSTRG